MKPNFAILCSIVNVCWYLHSASAQISGACKVAHKSCPFEDVSFFLYTREYQDTPQLLDMSNERSISEAQFVRDSGVPFKFIIHGFAQNISDSDLQALKAQYLEKWNWNLIFVDYSTLAKAECKQQALKNTPLIAKCSSKMIRTITQSHPEITLDQFHVIGCGLGAQIGAQMATYFKKNDKLQRITGLDPDFDGFFTVYSSRRYTLTRDDAHQVDIVHTHGGFTNTLLPTGSIDFYANGGIFQTGCCYDDDLCHQKRAIQYYTESIASKSGFWAYQCTNLWEYLQGECPKNNLARFGEYLSPETNPGVYFFDTNAEPPYAKKIAFSIAPKNKNVIIS